MIAFFTSKCYYIFNSCFYIWMVKIQEGNIMNKIIQNTKTIRDTVIRFLNKPFLLLLESLGYEVRSELKHKILLNHFFVIIASLIIFLYSWTNVKEIGFFLFLYYLFILFYKWVISFFKHKNLQKIYKQTHPNAIKLFKTPYKKELFVYSTIIILILFISFLVKDKNIDITHPTLYIITVYISILLNFIGNLYSGLVAIYAATPNIN